MTDARVPISVLIPTLDEESNIAGCLASVAWSDDVVVLDSGSKDRTAEIAAAAGARVVLRPFDDWSSHQNWALSHIRFEHSWVLHLDADERVPQPLRDELRVVAAGGHDGRVAFYCGRENHFMGRWLRHAFPPGQVLRFFRPGAVRFRRLVNPVAVIDGRHGYLRERLIHFNFSKGVGEWIAKHNRYSTLEAIEGLRALDEGVGLSPSSLLGDPVRRRASLKRAAFALPGRPVLKFLYQYVWGRGFLDGLPGLYYCLLQAFYELMIVLKMIELRAARKPERVQDGGRVVGA